MTNRPGLTVNFLLEENLIDRIGKLKLVWFPEELL